EVAKGRHDPAQAPHGTAVAHDCGPVGLCLTRGEVAVAEVGERYSESDGGPRRTGAVGAVAPDAGSAEDLFARAVAATPATNHSSRRDARRWSRCAARACDERQSRDGNR